MARHPVQRRLAAILAADVVGYSRLIEADEDGTRARLRSLQAELIDPQVAADGGRVVKTMGDGFLVEFASAVDAVRGALDLQGAIARRNADVPEDLRIVLRIGINVGDVIVEGDDIHGDGVNLAARLEGLCEPGRVYVSGTVYDQAEGKLAAAFDDLGERSVKNIAKPVRVYRARMEAPRESGTALGEAALSLPGKPSIAVLPFENMSGDAEQEYFSDGITEDIITELSKISGLFVIARHSSFTYKGKSVTLKQVGRELGVRYALEGSVRKAGNRLRITAQLIDTATDHHLWAERYDRDLEDIFAVQDDVTREISAALEVALGPTERNRLGRPPTTNIEAYDLFVQARGGFRPPTRENLLWARATYQRIVDMDPDFAGGYAGLSMTYTRPILLRHHEKTDEDVARARDHAEHALRLDEDLAASHVARSLVALVSDEPDNAIKFSRNAVERQPGDADANASLGRVLYIAGYPEDSYEHFRTAIRLDPRSTAFNAPLGHAYCMAERFADAIEAYRKVNTPGGSPLELIAPWVAAAIEVGNLDEAAAKAKEVLALDPGFSVSGFRFLERFAIRGVKDRMAAALIEAGLPE